MALFSVPGKVLALVLLERLLNIIKPQLLEAQCGFQRGCGTVDQIWVAWQIVERATEYHTLFCMSFVDLMLAYNLVDRQALIAILECPRCWTQELYSGTWCQVRAEGSVSHRFEVKSGVRQGCDLSPFLFNCFIDKIMRETKARLGGGLHIDYISGGGLFLTYWRPNCIHHMQDVLYTDDLALVAETIAAHAGSASLMKPVCVCKANP